MRLRNLVGAGSRWVFAALLAPALTQAGSAPEIDLAIGAQGLEWTVAGPATAVELTVSAPDGTVERRSFPAGAAVRLALREGEREAFVDGSYGWELRPIATPPRTRGETAAGGGAEGSEPAGAWTVSGSFAVAGGAILAPLDEEEGAPMGDAPAVVPEATVLTNSDGVIRNSLCVGFDCPGSPSFSDTTILLEENNTRIKFDDTSVGSFPNRDWQLFANDSASGGLNRFGVQDCGTGSGGGCSGNIPFTIEAATPANALYVDSTGRIGFGTSTPALELHVDDSDTPSLRLEQNGSAGFPPQTWDVAGNEANFFVRDVTSGSRLPFRIRPGAPTSSIDVSPTGDVGIGIAGPSAALHISRATGAVATLARFSNNSGVQTLFDRTDVGANDWQMSNFNATFQISIPGAATPQFSLNQNGNLTIGGTQYLTGSSRAIKENFVAVDARDILHRLLAMPLTSWNAKGVPAERHIGPIAEDWWTSFGLGPDDKHVGMTDLGGVALAAIQGLGAELQAKQRELADQGARLQALESQNAALLERLNRLESTFGRRAHD